MTEISTIVYNTMLFGIWALALFLFLALLIAGVTFSNSSRLHARNRHCERHAAFLEWKLAESNRAVTLARFGRDAASLLDDDVASKYGKYLELGGTAPGTDTEP